MSTASLPIERREIWEIHTNPNSVLLVDCEIQMADGARLQLCSAAIVRADGGLWSTTVVVFGSDRRGRGEALFGERHRTLPQAMARLGLDLARPHPQQETIRRDVFFVEKSDPDLPKRADGVLSALFVTEAGVTLAEALEAAAALPGARTTGVAQTEKGGPPEGRVTPVCRWLAWSAWRAGIGSRRGLDGGARRGAAWSGHIRPSRSR